jgi:hypothetical protein
VVPKEDPEALARGILAFAREGRRTTPATARLIEERFRADGVVTRYLALYDEAVAAG